MDMVELRDETVIPAIQDNGFAVQLVPMDSSDGEAVAPGTAMDGYAVDIGTFHQWKGESPVREGSRKLMAAGFASAPRPGDRIIIGVDTFRVVDTETVQPGGVALYYEVYIK